MPFRVVSNPSRNIIVVGETQSFKLEASGGAEEHRRIQVEWGCFKGNKHQIVEGPIGRGTVTWDNYRWTEKGDYEIVALIRVDGRNEQERVHLSVRVVGPGEYATINPKNRQDLARRFRIVADPPLRTVSPEQRMTFRLELTANDPLTLGRVKSVKWLCINDPSHAGLEDRPWYAGSVVYGGTSWTEKEGWVWKNAKWDFTGHHRIIAVIDYDGVRIDVEYPVHVVNLQALIDRAPAFSEAIDAPEVIEREFGTATKVIRDIEKRKPPPEHKKEAYEERMKQREEYAEKLRALLDSTRGKERFPIRAQYYSPHNAQAGGAQEQWMPLNVFLCEYEPGYWVLVDWTNPANERTSGVYDGWFGNRHRSPQEAISGWDWHNKYPEGIILYQWDADPAGRPLRADRWKRSVTDIVSLPPGRFETDGSSLAGEVSAVFEYIALGAAVVAGVVTLLVPEPSSKLLSAAIWSAIFSSTAAATINIAERRDNGFSNLRDDTFDALSIAANLLGAGALVRTGAAMGAMARGAVVTTRSLAITRGVIFASFGGDAIQGVMIAEKSWGDIDKILENPELAPDERLMEVVRVVGQLAATGALLAFNLRGTRHDAANLTRQNRHLPPDRTPSDILDELKNTEAKVNLDEKLRRAEGTTGEDVHTTTVQTTPGQVGRAKVHVVTGTHSGRPFDINGCGGPIARLDWRDTNITRSGIDDVKIHTSRFENDPANEKMIKRLERIERGEIEPTDYDKRFYTHELRELERYRAMGIPDNIDPGYEFWNNAHTATLEDFALNERKAPLYHPSTTGD